MLASGGAAGGAGRLRLRLYERHYSAYRYRDGRIRRLFCGPGQKLVLVTPADDALFVWRKFRSMDPEAVGICCAVFRNEGETLSSELILAAERLAVARWPGDPFYTYVDASAIRSSNPGACFLAAGWRRLKRRTKDRGLVVLVKDCGEGV